MFRLTSVPVLSEVFFCFGAQSY